MTLLIADANVRPEFLTAARNDTFHVVRLAEAGIARDASDVAILERASELGAVVLTQDKDFAFEGGFYQLGRRASSRTGIVVIRLKSRSHPIEMVSQVKRFFAGMQDASESLFGAIHIIESDRFRKAP